MANQNYNSTNDKDNKDLLMLLGIGAIAYFLIKDDKKQGLTTEDIIAILNSKNAEGLTKEDILLMLQSQKGTSNLTEGDIRRIVESYSQSYNSSNAQQQDRTASPSLSVEDLQRYLEDFQQKMSEEMTRQFDDYAIDKKGQDEQEEEKQILIDTYGEEYVTDYDMREKAKAELKESFEKMYNQRFPLVKDTFWDIYNFADSDTIIRRLADTQRNVIDVMRFRLNEAFPLTIVEDVRAGDYSVYNVAMVVDMINPTSTSVNVQFIPYHMVIDKVNFYPMSPWLEAKIGKQLTTIYDNISYKLDDKDSLSAYLKEIVNMFVTPIPWGNIQAQGKKMEEWADYYINLFTNFNVKDKNVNPFFTSSWWSPDMEHRDLYDKKFVKGAQIEVHAIVKDTSNMISRDIVMKGTYGERPTLADRDKAYIQTIIMQ